MQRTAAVVAEIDDQAVRALGLELAYQTRHVPRGALVIRVPGPQRLEIHVEGGHHHHADAVRAGTPLQFEDGLAGRLLLQLHHVADDLHHPRFGYVRPRRHHLQAHWRALGAADQLHHFVRAPAHDVHERLAHALAHGDDALVGLEAAAEIRRAALHQPMHHGVFVRRAEHRADAFERQRHVDVEVRRIPRRKILRVLVVGAGEGVHEQPEDVLAAGLADQPPAVLGALGQRVADLLQRIAGQLAAEHAALEGEPPERLQFVLAGRPRRLAAVQRYGFVAAEVEALQPVLEQRRLEGDAL